MSSTRTQSQLCTATQFPRLFIYIYIYPEKGHQINYIWINIIIKIRMEYQKIINLLDITPNQSSKFRAKNWFQINDDASLTYSTNSQIRF